MKTWRKYRTYKRVQKLWEEYKEAAQSAASSGDIALVTSKLSTFLDHFQASYHEFSDSAGHGKSLENFYGDCTEVLVNLLDLVDAHFENKPGAKEGGQGGSAGKIDDNTAKMLAEVIHKALRVAEMIIREDKYKEVTSTMPQVINKVLSLLETSKTTEAKTLLLRMIAGLSQSGLETRLEIGRLDGYRKVMKLLVEGEEGLSQEALMTLQHFLDVQEGQTTDGDAPPQLKEAIDQAAAASTQYGINLTVSPNIVWSTTKLVVKEMQRVFGPSGEEGAGGEGEVGAEESEFAIDDGEGGGKGGQEEFPPSRASIANRIEELEIEVREAYQEEEEATMEDELTPRAFANKLATELSESAGGNGNSSMGEEELMRELIGVQGALRSLAAKLAEAAKDVQLDVIATISVLLRNSRRNKREFRLVDGYSLMKNIFRGIQDYTSIQSQIFLDKVFSIMFTIILDGDRGRLAGNIDALELTFQLACASDLHLEVRIRAVQTIQELLIANALNVVACRRVRGFSQLIEAAVSVDAAHVTGSLSGEQQYVEQVIETLTYSAVLLSRHDWDITEEILRAVTDGSRQIHPLVRYTLVQCTRDLLRDRNSRQLKTVPMSMITCLIDALKLTSSSAPGSSETEGDGGSANDEDRSLYGFMRASHITPRGGKWSGTIVLFEALAHSLHAGAGAHVAAFAKEGGFDMLLSWFLSDAPSTVVALVLWLVLELVSLACINGADHAPFLEELLTKVSLSAAQRMLLMSMMRTWLHEIKAQGDKAAHLIRAKLWDAGVVSAVRELVATGGPRVSREALVVLGTLLSSDQRLKAWFESNIGCISLSRLVNESAIKPDLAVMEVLLLIANNSTSIEYVIAPNLLLPSSAPTDLIANTVLNVRRPGPRFASFLQSSREAHTDPSSTSQHSTLRRKDSTRASEGGRVGGGMSSSTSVRSEESRSSFSARIGGGVAHGGKGSSQTGKAMSTSSNTSSDMLDADQLLSGFGDDAARGSDDREATEKRLSMYSFRSGDAAFMVLSVLSKAGPREQERVIGVLLSVCELNPANGETLSKIEGITVLLGMINRCPAQLKGLYMKMLATIGRYNVRPEEVRLLFELAMPRAAEADEEGGHSGGGGGAETSTQKDEDALRLQMMSVIGQISERVTPPSCFYYDGRPGWVKFGVEKFPSIKSGYTLSFWMCVTGFQGDECSFLKWSSPGGQQILELYFQRIGAQGDAARCLSVRTGDAGAGGNAGGGAFAFNAFNAHSFVADRVWHHVGFTQCNKTLSLYLDGEFIQSCSFTAYPQVPSKTSVIGIMGGAEGDPGYLSCMLSSLVMSEGVSDARSFMALFEQGPLHGDKVADRGLRGLESKVVAVVHPRNSHRGRHSLPQAVLDMDNLRTGNIKDLVEDVFDRFASTAAQLPQSPSPDKSASKGNKSRPGGSVQIGVEVEQGGWVQSHSTRCLQEAIGDIGGMSLALMLLAPRKVETQVPALRILAGLLVRWKPNRDAFHELHGYSVLLYLLSQSELSFELFEILLDIATHGEADKTQRIGSLKDPLCTLLITDLLPLCAPELQRKILRNLEDSLLRSPQAAPRLWMVTPGLGLPILLNFLRTMASSLYTVLLAILTQMAPLWAENDLQLLCAFIIGDQQAIVDGKGQILELINQRMSSRHMNVEVLRGIGGWDIALSFLDHRAERIRVAGIKTLGLLLQDPKATKAFVRKGGFEAVKRIMKGHPSSAAASLAMLQLALGNLGYEDKAVSGGGGGASKGKRTVIHPGAVEVMIAMVSVTDDEELQVTTLTTIEMLVEDKGNTLILLQAGALDWMRNLLFPEDEEPQHHQASPSGVSTSRSCELGEDALRCAKDIVCKLVVGGLFIDAKLLKLKELCDDEEMHALVTNQILSHFERDPHVSQQGGSAMLRSLVQLLEPLVEGCPASSPSIYLQAVRSINRIANQNSDVVRSWMKEAVLLELRDNLLVHSLKLPLTKEGAFAIMQKFSFEWVAEKHAFREANGLAHLLHLFHAFPAERDLQIGVGCVLRNVLCVVEDNRRVVARLIEDMDIARHFFPSTVARAQSLDHQHGDDDEVDPSEESARAMWLFIDWYYHEEQSERRGAVEARINKVIAAGETLMKKNLEKALIKRNRRSKAVLERQNKNSAEIAKLMTPWDEDRHRRVQRDIQSNIQQEKNWTLGFQHRLGAGERRWIEVEAEITRTQGSHSHNSAQQHLQQAHNVSSNSVQPSSSVHSDGSIGGGMPRTGSSNSQRSDSQQQQQQQQHDSTDGPRRA